MSFDPSELSEFFGVTPFMFEGLQFCFGYFCHLHSVKVLALFSIVKAEEGERPLRCSRLEGIILLHEKLCA